MKIYRDLFNNIIAPENLFLAWDKFKKGKQNKRDVQKFEWQLEENIFKLYRELKSKKYRHGLYKSFFINDPKQRRISKADVRDRIIHQAVFNVLNPVFESTFIAHSFSCRVGKGTHRAVEALTNITRKIGKNNFKPCFVLKCDIKKFFDSIDHDILFNLIQKKIKDDKTVWLIKEIIKSFSASSNKGLPLGNITSQLFANIYLNKLDQFIKHKLKIKYYIRYCDDFVIIADNKFYLQNLITTIKSFLRENLIFELHPQKITIRKFYQGIDFLGYVVLPHHRLLRTKTRQRIFRKLEKRVKEYKRGTINKQTLEQSLQSYLGVLSHADTYKLGQELKNQFWFWLND